MQLPRYIPGRRLINRLVAYLLHPGYAMVAEIQTLPRVDRAGS